MEIQISGMKLLYEVGDLLQWRHEWGGGGRDTEKAYPFLIGMPKHILVVGTGTQEGKWEIYKTYIYMDTDTGEIHTDPGVRVHQIYLKV